MHTMTQKKGTTFLLRINLFNKQCSLTKFSTLIVNKFIINVTYLISGIRIISAPFYGKSVTQDIMSLAMVITEQDCVTG